MSRFEAVALGGGSEAQQVNKVAVRRLYDEVVTAGRLDLLADLVAEDATGFGAGTVLGPAGFAEHVRAVRDGLADVRADVLDLVAEGDRVVAVWRIRGRHVGMVWGVAATGRSVDAESVSIVTFRDGRIVDYQVRPDRLTVLQQVGVVESRA